MDLDKILFWQKCQEHLYLGPEYADFLSDFGRNEPFLVDGDAVIMHAFKDKLLDWFYGGQFLHHMYIVEKFLQELCSRGSKFDIFFLEGNAAIFQRHGASYFLARTIILHHLKSHESRLPFQVHLVAGSWINVHDVSTFNAAAMPSQTGNPSSVPVSFEDLIESLRPTFIMSNAGNLQPGHKIFAVAQMTFVHNHLVQGRNYNVVTFDSLKFEGSRIFGFLYNSPNVTDSRALRVGYDQLKTQAFADLFRGEAEKVSHTSATFSCAQGDLRTYLYLKSLDRVLGMCKNPRARGLAMISMGCLEMMRVLPLSDRAFVLPFPGPDTSVWSLMRQSAPDLAEVVTEFQNCLFSCLTTSIEQLPTLATAFDESDSTIADIFDGRVFTVLLLQLMAGHYLPSWLSEACVKRFTSVRSYSSKSSGTGAFNTDNFEIKLKYSNQILFWHVGSEEQVSDKWWQKAHSLLSVSEDESMWVQSFLEEAAHLRETKNVIELAKLQPVGRGKENMLSQVLGDVQDRMQRFEVQPHEKFLGLGSKWEEYDFPTFAKLTSLAGTEIENGALASALRQGKLEFTNGEWDNFKILDLSHDSFVKTGLLYFKPAALGPLQSHHFHNTKALAGEPDSFSYPFEKRTFFCLNSTEMGVKERIIHIKKRHPRVLISSKVVRILNEVSDARSQLILLGKSALETLMVRFEQYMEGFLTEKDFESEITFKL